jgi:hypothetical protein
MGERIARVDAYIAKAQPFARPILQHLRDVVHASCPDVCETIKWGMPFFEYEGLLCHMAAFKGHAVFGFYHHAALVKASRTPATFDRSAMGSFGRLESVADLPPRRVLGALVKLAMQLADERAELREARAAKPLKRRAGPKAATKSRAATPRKAKPRANAKPKRRP